MSSNYFPYAEDDYWDDDYFDDDWYAYAEEDEAYQLEWESYTSQPIPIPQFLNGWTIVGLLMILMFGYAAFSNQSVSLQNSSTKENRKESNEVREIVGVQTAVSAPYPEYTLTQGLHGQSYGHLAVDIAAGRGEPILSPVNGEVTESYIDEYNNTTLVIENEAYVVTLLHGEFSVNEGDIIEIGDKIGIESNKGYTMDMQGNLCYGREYCGNHTHLNIYDKRLQANINPLDLISTNPISSH